jgi:hypothetical protein
MDRYDPDLAPDPEEWLALDEQQRTLLVEQYHRDARIKMPRRARALHAAIHAIVENQLALEEQAIVRESLRRVMSEGLTRHEAVHAIGSVLVAYLNDRFNEGQPTQPTSDQHAQYYAALRELTAQKWRGG